MNTLLPKTYFKDLNDDSIILFIGFDENTSRLGKFKIIEDPNDGWKNIVLGIGFIYDDFPEHYCNDSTYIRLPGYGTPLYKAIYG